MLPDNQDALKVWLIQTLNPICDADPDTLANYILALIRKDKPENDLIELCNKDLDDFLQDHTKSFVDTLFEALRSKIYLHEVDRHAGRPQASQKLAHSPSNGPEQTPHLTSYKSLPKRDQEQIRPKEFEMKSRRTERRLEDSSVGSREKWRQDRRYSKSPQSRGRNDLSRERRKFSQVRNRANEQTNPRDVTSPPLRLGKRSYTRSLSKSVDPHEVEQDHATRRSSGEGSGSDSPEGSTKVAKRNRSRSNSRERRDGIKKQRCRMYYELGFCELGDKCLYDHGKNPVLISNRELALQNSFEYSPSNYLPPPGAPSLMHQTVIPNMSQPPPALPFSAHRLPPAHFLTPQGNALLLTQPPMRPMMPYGMPPTHRPPPPIFPFLPLPTGELQQEVYQPGTVSAVEPYMPEPYSSKSSHFSLPPPPIQTQPTLVKGTTWKEEESKPDGSTALARQVSNLVHVSINEGRAETDPELLGGDQQYEVASSGDGNVPSYTPTPSSVLNARKRSSKMAGLEQVNLPNSEGFGAEDAKLMPPPSSYVKKPTMEHPGENLLPVVGVTNRNQSASNTTLELRKIPREDNTISNINGHFSKFGIIINLQVNWDNDPCAALVSYASSAQASAAYRSKEPFLNNRFIKIFWHNPEKSQQHQGGGASQNNTDSRSVDKDYKSKPKYTIPQRHQLQLNRLKKPDEVKKGQEGGEVNLEKQSEDEASKIGQMPSSEDQQKAAPTSPTLQQGENVERIVIPPRSALRLQRKPDKEMQKANAMKKELEWRQKTQELLKKLLETQKNLLELHIKTKSPEEKAKYSQLLKNNDVKIQELNEELKKPLNSSSSPNVDAHKKPFPAHKNKYSKNNKQLVRTNSNSGLNPANHEDSHEAQKAQLDGELDMIANKKEADVLRKKISDIKNVIGNIDGDISNEDVDPSSSSSSSYPYNNNNKFNYNQDRGGRMFAKVSRSVDRRPRQILITGFPVSLDKSTLLNHMKNFGQVEKSLFDDKTPFFLVTYRYRSDAERAMKDGNMFEDVKLKLVWHNSEPQQQAAKQQTPQCVPQAVSSFFPSSSSSSAHIHLGLVDQKVDDQPESGTSDSNVHSTEEGGSPVGGGNEYGDDDLSDYRKWADVDEDALLYEEDEEDEDDDEGVRPWRRR